MLPHLCKTRGSDFHGCRGPLWGGPGNKKADRTKVPSLTSGGQRLFLPYAPYLRASTGMLQHIDVDSYGGQEVVVDSKMSLYHPPRHIEWL